MSGRKNDNHRTIFFTMVFIIQLIISNYVHLGPYVYICLLPLIIAGMPMKWRPSFVMIVSFGLGLLLDLLSDGTLGLNAGAAVFCSALRKQSYRLIISRDRQDKTIYVSPKTAGTVKFFSFLVTGIITYTLAYVLLDCLDFRGIVFIFFKFIASSLVNVVLILLLSVSFLNRN